MPLYHFLTLATLVALATAENVVPLSFDYTVTLEPGGQLLHSFPTYATPCGPTTTIEALDGDYEALINTTVLWSLDYEIGAWYEADFDQTALSGRIIASVGENTTEPAEGVVLPNNAFAIFMRKGVSQVNLVLEAGPNVTSTSVIRWTGTCEKPDFFTGTFFPNFPIFALIYVGGMNGLAWYCCNCCRNPAALKLNPYLKPDNLDQHLEDLSTSTIPIFVPSLRSVENARKICALGASVVAPQDDLDIHADLWELESPSIVGFLGDSFDGFTRRAWARGASRIVKMFLVLLTIILTCVAYAFRFGVTGDVGRLEVAFILAYLSLVGSVVLTNYRVSNAYYAKRRAYRLLSVGIVVDLDRESLLAFFGPLIVSSAIVLAMVWIWAGGYTSLLVITGTQLLAFFVITYDGYNVEAYMLPLNKLMEVDSFRNMIAKQTLLYVSAEAFDAYRLDRGTKIRDRIQEVFPKPSIFLQSGLLQYSWQAINRKDLEKFLETFEPTGKKKGRLARMIGAPRRILNFMLQRVEPIDVYDPLRVFPADPRLKEWLKDTPYAGALDEKSESEKVDATSNEGASAGSRARSGGGKKKTKRNSGGKRRRSKGSRGSKAASASK